MSKTRGRWGMALKIAALLVVVAAGGLALLADGVLCGPVSSWWRPHPAGGPHYYLSFNHLCWPFSPVSPAPDGMRPGRAQHNVLEASFDEKRRISTLTSWDEKGKLFWRQTTTYHPNGRVATLSEGQIGDKWKRAEYDTRGNLLREIAIEPPTDTVWQPAK